jgi:predicted acylesterase/phospholipase RssA
MNIPGVFKPVYINSKDRNGNELKGTNLKSGLYVDSGLTNNMPMTTFLNHSPFLDNRKIDFMNIFGFRVFDGPNPNTFKKLMPYIWDNSKYYSDENRLLYSKYLLDYFQKNDQLPTRLSPITYYDIPSAPRGIFGTTLLKMLGYTLDTVLNASTLNDLTEDLNKNIVDVYSYNITTMDFTPDSNLLKFVVNQAEIRANALLKYTASRNKN